MSAEILFITRKFPPSVGGIERHCAGLARELGRLHRLHLVAWGGSQRWLPYFLGTAALRSIRLLASRRSIGVILLGDALLAPLGHILRTLSGRPVAVSAHGLDIIYAHPVYRALVPPSLARMDRVIAGSEYSRELCVDAGVHPERCGVIPYAVTIPAAPPLDAAARRRRVAVLAGQSMNDRQIVLTVGRLIRRKGVHRFVERILPRVIATSPRAHYVIAGDGPERVRIIAAIQASPHRDRISLIGPVDDSDLAVLYHAADVFAMPNVHVPGDAEGFGLVALEAASVGCPVVASRLEGLAEAVTDGENGVLVEPEDDDGFAHAVSVLLNDCAARTALRNRARRFTLERHEWSLIARRYSNALAELARSGRTH